MVYYRDEQCLTCDREKMRHQAYVFAYKSKVIRCEHGKQSLSLRTASNNLNPGEKRQSAASDFNLSDPIKEPRLTNAPRLSNPKNKYKSPNLYSQMASPQLSKVTMQGKPDLLSRLEAQERHAKQVCLMINLRGAIATEPTTRKPNRRDSMSPQCREVLCYADGCKDKYMNFLIYIECTTPLHEFGTEKIASDSNDASLARGIVVNQVYNSIRFNTSFRQNSERRRLMQTPSNERSKPVATTSAVT